MELILTIEAFIIGILLVAIAVPPIIRVAKAKHLFEPFEERKIHTKVVPPLGGVAIFISFTLSAIVATDGLSFDSLKYNIASVILTFFIGLKDDLMVISAHKKLMVQILAAFVLILLGNVRFSNLHGMFGIHEIGFIPGIIITAFAMVVIINAYNLIDGIDGLASGLAILEATAFGAWFYVIGNPQFAILSFALVGSLAGFFFFNVFGDKYKLFMGDTGSLIIGLIISTLVVKFNEFNLNHTVLYAISAAPSVSFAIIIVPLIDTLRVMTIRIFEKRSPFSPDKSHIHHKLLELVNSHLKVTLIFLAANVIIVAFALLLNKLAFNINIQFLLVFLLGVLFSLIPSVILKLIASEKQRSAEPVNQTS